jgi:hypothetical protein
LTTIGEGFSVELIPTRRREMGYDRDKVAENLKKAKDGWRIATGKDKDKPKPSPETGTNVHVDVNVNTD